MRSFVLAIFILLITTGCDSKPSEKQLKQWQAEREVARIELNAFLNAYDFNRTSIPIPQIDRKDLNRTKVPNPINITIKNKIGLDIAKAAARYRYYDRLLSCYPPQATEAK